MQGPHGVRAVLTDRLWSILLIAGIALIGWALAWTYEAGYHRGWSEARNPRLVLPE